MTRVHHHGNDEWAERGMHVISGPSILRSLSLHEPWTVRPQRHLVVREMCYSHNNATPSHKWQKCTVGLYYLNHPVTWIFFFFCPVRALILGFKNILWCFTVMEYKMAKCMWTALAVLVESPELYYLKYKKCTALWANFSFSHITPVP